MLEQNLHTLESHGILENQPLEKIMMEAREPLEWQFKQLDQAVGLSFKSKFHFALVGHLIKGLRHPVQNTVARTIRLLHILLAIVAKSEIRDKFQVTLTSVPYLTALISVSEEVRCRCHLKYLNNNIINIINLKNTPKQPNQSANSNNLNASKKNASNNLNVNASNTSLGKLIIKLNFIIFYNLIFFMS